MPPVAQAKDITTEAKLAEAKVAESIHATQASTLMRTALSTQGYVHAVKVPDGTDILPLQKIMSGEINGLALSRSLVTTYPKLLTREMAIEQHSTMLRSLNISRRKAAVTLTLPPYDATVPPEATRAIKAIGFEIEGCWRLTRDVLPYHVATDGSVRATIPSMHTTGEVRMGPYPNGVIDTEQVQSQYPDHVNSTCGLHVHLSFPNHGLYASFMSKEFYYWFIEGLKHWRTVAEAQGAPRSETFWNRINGNNVDFCAVNYRSEDCYGQLNGHANRYNAINYCLTRHGTIEVRVLNAWATAEECLLAVNEVKRLFILWAHQFKLPVNTLTYGDEESLSSSNLSVESKDFPAILVQNHRLVVHPGFRIANVATQTTCSKCTNRGFITHPRCNCVEWCSDCQPYRHKEQSIKHSQLCWGGYWCRQNIICGLPESFCSYYGLVAFSGIAGASASACPACGVEYPNHMRRPTEQCLLGYQDNAWYGFELNRLS